mgnify:CR=1 FL=1
MMSSRHSPAVLLLLGVICMALHVTTAASEVAPGLRASVTVAVVETSRVGDTDDLRQQQRRKVEESLEALYVDNEEDVEDKTHNSQKDKEETAVHESESMNEGKSSSVTGHAEDAVSMSKQENTSAAKHTTPSATLAERETEDPMLVQEESPSLMFLNLNLSLAVQRFLAFMAAVLGMILTAHQIAENPDGLYASLCRSILTVIRTVCRIVTCKPCSRDASAHRHIPISTMEYGFKVTDPAAEFQ